MSVLICEGTQEQVMEKFTMDECVELDRQGVKIMWTEQGVCPSEKMIKYLTAEQMVRAFELRAAGERGYRIAILFGITERKMYTAFARAKEFGLSAFVRREEVA